MLSLAPLFYTTRRCRALRKPTEQPVEQWYASLVGKVSTKYLSKGCGYGSKRGGKVRYLITVLKENEKDSTHQTCAAAKKLGEKMLRQSLHG
jgi:hypothetical protein